MTDMYECIVCENTVTAMGSQEMGPDKLRVCNWCASKIKHSSGVIMKGSKEDWARRYKIMMTLRGLQRVGLWLLAGTVGYAIGKWLL